MQYGESKWGGESRKLLCKTANGCEVFLDNDATNIGIHLQEEPQLLELVTEALVASEINGENVALEVDLGRIIGVTNCVTTTDDDEILYARRKGRDSFSRFIKNREPQQTSKIAVILHKKIDGYNLWSAWCGEIVPTKPDSTGKMRTVEGFWDNHALIYDPKIIEQGTETKSPSQ